MIKIKDRHVLGIVAGLCGFAVKTLIDEISTRYGFSERAYRHTAAGVWVNSRRQANNWKGGLLGAVMDAGLSMLGGVFKVMLLCKNGRDHLLLKGAFYGSTFGAIITAMLSGFSANKVKPKDAGSNLSYVFATTIYGIVCTFVAAKLGHDSLFDSQPINDYVKPSEKTTEQVKLGTNQVAK